MVLTVAEFTDDSEQQDPLSLIKTHEEFREQSVERVPAIEDDTTSCPEVGLQAKRGF